MNATLLNRRFEMPADGWYQLAPLGEFPHAKGLQVIDQAAAETIVERFGNRRTQEGDRFSGVLIDFDRLQIVSERLRRGSIWCQMQEPWSMASRTVPG